MELIVTAGAMQEEIDHVRAITNHATGALGRLTAEAFARMGGARVQTIYYVSDESAQTPTLPCVQPVRARGARQTSEVIGRLLRTRRIAAMVHSMAVSDYAVRAVATAESLARALAARLAGQPRPLSAEVIAEAVCAGLSGEAALPRRGKYPSDMEHPLLFLERTPKLIAMIKDLSPQTLLVGFKLLDGVPREELLRVAGALLRRNGCDYVLANDLQSIRDGCHTGYLLGRDGSCAEERGKEAIAARVARTVLGALEKGTQG